jgi:hypothetical protein
MSIFLISFLLHVFLIDNKIYLFIYLSVYHNLPRFVSELEYIYIYREREREREILSLLVYLDHKPKKKIIF